MKIPLSWLKDYVKTDASPRTIAANFTQLGLMLDKPLDDSGVIDLEHRMDRADWLSIIGCARDYAAFTKTKLNYPRTNTKALPNVSPQEMVEITVKTPHVNRFNTRLVKNLVVKDSPAWLKERLSSYGIKSINNVVDITNFVMVEYGQPMHAQDLAKLKKREITLRPAKAGEQLTTILGSTVTLNPDIFVLSSGGVATVIGGIVGGLATSVTNQTTEIVLDAGNYDQRIIRKNSRALKIINETVSRYDKFLHPDLCEIALDRATYLLETLADGKVYNNYDYYPKPIKPTQMTLTYNRLKNLSGQEFNLRDIKRILTALEYQLVEEDKSGLTVTIPSIRTDVEVEDDIVADILRISDYSNIKTQPLQTPPPTRITPEIVSFEEYLRDLLVAQGAHEHITTSLVKNQNTPGEIMLSNALSADQNALRTTLLPNLEAILANYHKHNIQSPSLFEIGKVFAKQGSKYQEIRHLTLVSQSEASTHLATLFNQLNLSYSVNNQFEIIAKGELVGTLNSHSFTLITDRLMPLTSKYGNVISEFIHQTTRDLSLLAKSSVSYFDISELISRLYPAISLSCKTVTNIAKQTNYVLTLSTTQESKLDLDVAIKKINQELKSIGVVSKS